MTGETDLFLTALYERSGLFAKIIDLPADEAMRGGFEINGISSAAKEYYTNALEWLEWDKVSGDAIRWARLYGGALTVALINDGGGLEDQLNLHKIRSVDGLRVYDRSIVRPVFENSISQDKPTKFKVFSGCGDFTVHESRCFVFHNAVLPEKSACDDLQFWGVPEYSRIQKELRAAETASGQSTKLLDRSNQAIHKMKNLSAELATEEGEERVLRRLQTIDIARSLLNSIAIDADETYTICAGQFSGVRDTVNAAFEMLSAVTGIPQTILFGSQRNAINPLQKHTEKSESQIAWYQYVAQLQRTMLKEKLIRILSLLFRAGKYSGEPVGTCPPVEINFSSLHRISQTQKADAALTRAKAQLARAQTSRAYFDMGAIALSDIRRYNSAKRKK